MNFTAGDRVRWECTGDDGLPLVHYGFVGGQGAPGGPVVVMLDGEISGKVIPAAELHTVTLDNLELVLHGADLVDDPALRRGLLALWEAEVDNAGLAVEGLGPVTHCSCTGTSWPLAQLFSCGDRYVVHAFQLPDEPDFVRVRADRHDA